METKNIGVVIEVTGAAEIRGVDGVVRVLNEGDKVSDGELLTTGQGGQAEIEFFDGQRLKVGENTEVLLDETVMADLAPFPASRVDQLAELQQLIVEGVDLTELEAPAAGEAETGGQSLHAASIYTRVGEEGSVDTQLTSYDTANSPDTQPDNREQVAAADSSGSSTSPAPVLATIAIDPITDDNIVNAAEAASTVDITGTVGGAAIAGSSVTLLINGTEYSGVVASDLSFTIPVAGADLAAQNSFQAVVSGNDAAGNPYSDASTTTSVYTVDVATTATISIDPITGDNLLDYAESTGTVVLTGQVAGDVAPGDSITLVLNGTAYTTTVQADNSYAISVAGSDLATQTEFSISVSGSDDAGNPFTATTTASYSLDLTVPNTAPQAIDDGFVTTNEDTPLSNINVLANDSDTDADALSVVSASADNGTVTINSDGSLNYSPNSDFHGVDSISYTISDGRGGSDTATVNVTVNAVNDAASVTSDAQVLSETDAELSASGKLSSTDVDNDDNAFTAATINGVIGDFSIDATGNWKFTANDAFNNLNTGETVNETFNVATVDGTPSTVQITITGTNDAATVSSDSKVLVETDSAVSTSGTLTSTDIDNTDNVFTPETITGGIGTFTIDASGYWTFTANDAFDDLNEGDKNSEIFSVTTVDGTSSTVQITINGTNDTATISSDTATVTEDQALTASGELQASGSIMVADADSGQAFVQPQTDVAGSYGTFSIDADGNWSYVAANDQSAIQALDAGDKLSESFSVTSQDGSASSTVTVTIKGAEDPSDITVEAGDSDSGVVTEDLLVNISDQLTASGSLSVNDVDGDGAFDTLTSFNGSTGNGGVQLGALTIDASGNWNYTVDNTSAAIQTLDSGESIVETYTVSTADGSDSQTITITINGAEESLLVVVNDSNAITEDASPDSVVGNVLSNDYDPDGDTVYVVSVQGNPTNLGVALNGTYGSIVVNADGSYTYTLDNARTVVQELSAGQTVSDSFSYTIDDGYGNQGNATINIQVTGTNDAAIVTSSTKLLAETDLPVSTSGVLTSTDVDNADNEFNPATIDGTIGTFSIDASGDWTFDANQAFDSLNVGENVNETFNVSTVDGTPSTVQITINGTNDAATVSSDSKVLSETDAAVSTSGTLTSTDVDNADNEFTPATINGTIGTFSIDASGDWTFDANQAFDSLNVGENVNETFNVSTVDGTPSTVQITINGTNDAATVSSDSQVLSETDAALTSSGTLTSSDVDNTDNAFTPVTINGTIGRFSIDASGAWTFEANQAFDSLNVGENVNETFNVSTVDGTPSTVEITINGTNDAPTTSVDTYSVAEGGSLTVGAIAGFLANDSDAEGSAISISQFASDTSGSDAVSADGSNSITTTLGGSLIVNADGSFSYTPPAVLDHSSSDTLQDSFAYLATDGSLNSSWTQVTFDVTDTAPVAMADTDSVGYGGTIYGNVISGAGGAAGGEDSVAADGATLTSVTYQGTLYNSFDGSGNLSIVADHGTLTINQNGFYSYASSEEDPVDVSDDVFSYVIEDADGDSSGADLTMVHDDINAAIADTTTVYESGLAAGTQAATDLEISSGNLLDNDTGIGANTEISQLTFGGTTATPVGGVITIDGDYGSLTVYTTDSGTHRAGDYQYTLTSASSGDTVSEVFQYSLEDSVSGQTSSNSLTVNIVDDAPAGDDVVQNLASGAEPLTYNVSIVLDVSGSMSEPTASGQSRLEVAVESLEALVREVDDLGNVNVQIVAFSGSTTASGWIEDDIYSVISFLNGLEADGYTYYDSALNSVINSGPAPTADQSLVYFVSDGESTDGHGVDDTISYTNNAGTTLTGQAAWEAYVDENADIAFGIGIGSASLTELEQVAHPEVNGNEDYAITVDDPSDLTATLLETVSNNVISGSLTVLGVNGAAGFVIGADGGYVSEITIDGTVYSYDPLTSPSSEITVTTALGGVFVLDMASGEYTYTLDVDQATLGQVELFPVSVIDNDGDSYSANIQFNLDFQPGLDANRDIIITNVSDGTPITVSSDALMHNDRLSAGGAVTATGGAIGGSVSGTDQVVFAPDSTVALFSESDFETVGEPVIIIDRNDFSGEPSWSPHNNSAATATDFSDRSMFSSNDDGLYGVTDIDGYSAGYYGGIYGAGDQDWIKVSLAEGENIWLDADLEQLGLIAHVYDGDGNYVAAIDYNGGSIWGGFTAPASGTYYLVIEADTDGASGTYDLFMTINTDGAVYPSFDYTIENADGVQDGSTAQISAVTGDTITGGNESEILLAGSGDDTLVGNAGDDALLGNAGDDILQGGEGDDLLIGGSGDDSLVGGAGIDMFALEAGDEGSTTAPAVDTIADFSVGADGDVLDLSDMLQAEDLASLDSYLNFSYDSGTGDTTISIDTHGGASFEASQQIVLSGVDLTAGGTLTDQQILDNLLSNGNLIVDQ